MAGASTDRDTLTRAEEQALARAQRTLGGRGAPSGRAESSRGGGGNRARGGRPSDGNGRRRAATPTRQPSLDLLRGLAVVASVLLLAGTAPAELPPWARVSDWHGYALADLVLPAFLVTAGMSLAHLEARLAALPAWRGWLRMLRRTVLLIGLGLGLSWLADPDLVALRWTGLLPRIGLASLLAWLLARAPRRWQVAGVVAVVTGWGTALERVAVPGRDAPGLGPDANLARWVDHTVLGTAHTVGPTDPLGLATTLPAATLVVAGIWLGSWLRRRPAGPATAAAMAVAGAWLGVLAIGWAQVTPLNATLWTPPYLLFATGAVLAAMAVIHVLADLLPLGGLLGPVRSLGRNPLVAYTLPAATVAWLSRPGADGRSAWTRTYEGFFGPVFGELGGLALGVGLLALTLWVTAKLDRHGWHLRA